MRNTYIAPTSASRGDVVRITLGSKPVFDEILNEDTKPSGGGSLSFGL